MIPFAPRMKALGQLTQTEKHLMTLLDQTCRVHTLILEFF